MVKKLFFLIVQDYLQGRLLFWDRRSQYLDGPATTEGGGACQYIDVVVDQSTLDVVHRYADWAAKIERVGDESPKSTSVAVVCEEALTGPLNERYAKDGGEKHSNGVTHEGVLDALSVECSHGVVVGQKG